jgi:Tfp pilus assembly protein PilF
MMTDCAGWAEAVMLADRYGLPLSTRSTAARDAYVAGVDGLLAANVGAETCFERALVCDPDFALAHIAMARWQLLAGDVAGAKACAAQARACAARTTPREQGQINAIALGIDGNAPASLAAIRDHLAEHPRDAMALAPACGVFGLVGFSGRAQRERELLDMLRALAPHYGADWWFLAMLAFAACESGALDEAEDCIVRSLEGRPDNAHGVHVRTHVLIEQGHSPQALAFLAGWLAGYARAGLMHCHLSWHLALLALELGDAPQAWSVYLADVHPGAAWGPPLNVASDAPSFLWRAELAGHDRRAPLWRAVHRFVGAAYPVPGLAFIDVHRAVAQAAVDDAQGLAVLAAELRERLAAGRLPAGSVVGLLAEGFAAFARSDWPRAILRFEQALPDVVRIGGSRAQRDLVEFTLLAAYLKAGRSADARRFLAARSARRAQVTVAGLFGS